MLAWCGQRLEEHSLGAFTVVARPSELGDRVDASALEPLIHGVTTRISRLTGIGAGPARRLVELAACIHDAGKAHPRYQAVLSNLCGRDEERISLAGHELLSAWVAYTLLTNPLIAEALGVDTGNSLRAALLVAAGVALHHSARRSIFEAYYQLLQRLPTPLDHEFIEGASRVSSICLSTVGAGVREQFIHAQLSLAVRQPYPILNLIESTESMSRNEARAAELLAYIVSVADNIDACLHRAGFPTRITRRFVRGGSTCSA